MLIALVGVFAVGCSGNGGLDVVEPSVQPVVAGLDSGGAAVAVPFTGRWTDPPPGTFRLLGCSSHGDGVASVQMGWTANPGVELPIDTVLSLGVGGGDVVDEVGSVRVTLAGEGQFAVTIPEALGRRARRTRSSFVADGPFRVGGGASLWPVLTARSRCHVYIGGEYVDGGELLTADDAKALEFNAPEQTVERLAQEASADADHPFSWLTTLYGRGWDLHVDHLWLLTDGSNLDAVWEDSGYESHCFGIDMAYGDLTVRQQIDCGPVGGDELWRAGSRWFAHIEDGDWDVLISATDKARVESARKDMQRFTYLFGQGAPDRPREIFERAIARTATAEGELLAAAQVNDFNCDSSCSFVYVYELGDGKPTNIAAYPEHECLLVEEASFTLARAPKDGTVEVDWGDGRGLVPVEYDPGMRAFLSVDPVRKVSVLDADGARPGCLALFEADRRGGLGSFLEEHETDLVDRVTTRQCNAPVNDDPDITVRSPAVCLDDSPFGPIKVTVRDRIQPNGNVLVCATIREGDGSHGPCVGEELGLVGDHSVAGYQRALVLTPEGATEVTVVTRSGFEIRASAFGRASYVYWAEPQGTLGWLEARTPDGIVLLETFWDEA